MEINSFIKTLFERAQAAGYEASEAYYATGESFEVSVKGGEIVDYNVSSSIGLSFRALVDGKMGYASTQVLDEDAIDLLIEGAGGNARMIESEDEEFIFEGSKSYPEMNIYNPAIDEISAAAKIEMAKELEKKVLALNPLIKQVEMVQVASMGGEKRIVNSKGLDVSFRDNAIGCAAVAIAAEGDKVAVGVGYQYVRDPKQLNPDEAAERAVRDAVSGLNAAPVESGAYPVVLRNDVAASLLNCFSAVFSAERAQKGLSLLKGKEGSEIAAKALTIVDDPLDVKALASTPFDAEGVATSRREIVSEGKLNTLLHNLKTAKKQGIESTGNASKGSYASPVGIAPTNFYIVPGEADVEALCRQASNGLLITEVEGLHSGANQISGDFSLGAKGYRIENGEVTTAVNQITIAGNFFELLKSITMIGNDLEFGFPGASCIGAPSVLVSKLSVAGK